jgi:hypothetical protein
MDVDASERRPDGGRRGSHKELQPRQYRRRRRHAGLAATDRRSVMDKPSELYVIREPETVERKVLHLSGIRSHGPAEARPVGRPWPRQAARRDRLRHAKSGDPADSSKTD